MFENVIGVVVLSNFCLEMNQNNIYIFIFLNYF